MTAMINGLGICGRFSCILKEKLIGEVCAPEEKENAIYLLENAKAFKKENAIYLLENAKAFNVVLR